MPMDLIVVWGAGGHARVVAQSLRRQGRWQLHGFIDDLKPGRAQEAFAGSVVLGGRGALVDAQGNGVGDLALAFGNNAARLALGAQYHALGWRFPTIIDRQAIVADDVVLGDGSYVAAGAVVQPGARIGAQVIINTGAIVEHDCRVGDGAHICPRACLAGHAEVGRGAWVGAGALVRDGAKVGAGAFVGIGALVVADVEPGWMVYGHPARPIRRVQA